MQPVNGRVLSRPSSIKQLWEDAVEKSLWVMQPKLAGERGCLACSGGVVQVQDRYGRVFRKKVSNAADFLKLPDQTCFDGVVYKGNFYPFELLASGGNSLLMAEVHERVALAKAMAGFLKHPWMFETPSLAWLMRRRGNSPVFDGVVLKQVRSRYLTLGNTDQSNPAWMRRLWS